MGGGAPISFPMPDLPNRLISSDQPEFVAVCVGHDNKPHLGGKFIDGAWRGHLHSNGCLEAENPTSIEAVREALAAIVMQHIDRFSGVNERARQFRAQSTETAQ